MERIKVTSKKELKKIIQRNIPLDIIDTSEITDMRNLISNDNGLSLLWLRIANAM